MSICMDNMAVEQPDGKFLVFPIGSFVWVGLKINDLLTDKKLIAQLRDTKSLKELSGDDLLWELSFEETKKLAEAGDITIDPRACDIMITLPIDKDEITVWQDYEKSLMNEETNNGLRTHQ